MAESSISEQSSFASEQDNNHYDDDRRSPSLSPPKSSHQRPPRRSISPPKSSHQRPPRRSPSISPPKSSHQRPPRRPPSLSPPRSSHQRPPRQRTVPAKLKEAEVGLHTLEEAQLDMRRSVVVKCSQTGKSHTVKLKDLSREDCEPLTKSDLVKGSDLMVDMKGKLYPVKFTQFKDTKSTGSSGKSKGKSGKSSGKASEKTVRKRPIEIDEEETGTLRDQTNVPEILSKAKNQHVKPPPKKPRTHPVDQENISVLDNGDKDLLVDLAKKIEKLEKTVVKMMDMLKSSHQGDNSDVQVKTEDIDCVVNGVNVMRLPSRDGYLFGLQLLDILFTKEELSISLLFKSKKSERSGLDQERVEKMLKLIERRYGNEWNLRTLTQKVNQKCRDKK